MVLNESTPERFEVVLESPEIIGGHTNFLVTNQTKHNYIVADLLNIDYWPCDVDLVTLFGNQYYIIGGIIIEVQGHETYFQVIELSDSTIENINQAIIGWKQAESLGWIPHLSI